jgi:hypothetical protein
MLYVMTERWPAGHNYRDVFERIKVSVTDAIANGKRAVITTAGESNDVKERCRGLNEGFSGGAKNDITRMITDMTGESVTLGTGVSPALPEGSDEPPHELPAHFNINDPHFINNLEQFEALSNEWDLALFNGASFDFGEGGGETRNT